MLLENPIHTQKQPEEPALVKEIKALITEQTSELESRIAKQASRITELEALLKREERAPARAEGKRAAHTLDAPPGYGEDEERVRVLYVSDIAAGLPIGQREDPDEYLDVPARYIKTEAEDYYAASIRGQSMTDAGIPDGCVALIRKADAPRDGAVQVVRCGGKSTLKRMVEGEGKGRRLKYEDGSGAYIDPGSEEEYEVQGEFVTVL
jgi:SOS-response transcriptional repressor LexA